MQYKADRLLLSNLDKIFDFFNNQKHSEIDNFVETKICCSYFSYAKSIISVLIGELLYLNPKSLDIKVKSAFEIIQDVEQCDLIFCEVLELLALLENILLENRLFNNVRILNELVEKLILEFSSSLNMLENAE